MYEYVVRKDVEANWFLRQKSHTFESGIYYNDPDALQGHNVLYYVQWCTVQCQGSNTVIHVDACCETIFLVFRDCSVVIVGQHTSIKERLDSWKKVLP